VSHESHAWCLWFICCQVVPWAYLTYTSKLWLQKATFRKIPFLKRPSQLKKPQGSEGSQEGRPEGVHPVRRKRRGPYGAQKAYAAYRVPAEAGAQEWGYEDEKAREARGPQAAPQDKPPCYQYPATVSPKGVFAMSPEEHEERTKPARCRRCDEGRRKNTDIRATPHTP